MIVVGHLLADPDAAFTDLGSEHFARDVNTDAKRRNHIRQLEPSDTRSGLGPAA